MRIRIDMCSLSARIFQLLTSQFREGLVGLNRTQLAHSKAESRALLALGKLAPKRKIHSANQTKASPQVIQL